MYSVLITLIVIFYIFIKWFFRKPVRISQLPQDTIVSPADGTVMNAEGRNVSIFLDILNVHHQYIPIDSRVKSIEIITGKYKMAFVPKSVHNHGVKIVFITALGELEVTQRVGFIARRIVEFVKPGDIVKRGDIYGLIRFGSRVDLVLPLGMTTTLKKGDKVKAGLTPIAM